MTTIYQAGHELVELNASDDSTLEFLDSYLDRATPEQRRTRQPFASISMSDEVLNGPARVTVHGTVALSRNGGAYRIGRAAPDVPLDKGEMWGALRKLLREIWLVRWAPDGDYYYLHASAVDDGRNVVIFTGDRRSGKTTLMLDSVAHHRYSLLTNDGLLFFRCGSEIMISPLPTLAKIRDDVAERFWPFLSARMLDPFNTEQLSSWRTNRSAALGDDDRSLYLTFGALGRKFECVRLAERRVLVVGLRFRAGGIPIGLTSLPPVTARAMVEHNRKAPAPTFAKEVGFVPATAEAEKQLVGELVKQATSVEFTHAGDVGPVLESEDR